MQGGVRLGPFEVLHPLGSGGMGEVWAATHGPSGAPVAVKLIGYAAARSARFREAFRNEVRASAALTHDAIARVLDAGEVPPDAAAASDGRLLTGTPYLVTERLDGGSLQPWLSDPRDWSELRRVLLRLLAALGHAHARGVVHRDVKPSNVLLDAGGAPKLVDFGIAHLQDGEGRIEDLGTPLYTAPEQHLRQAWIGPPADLYALGCTAWALVTGRPPFSGRDGPALQQAHLEEEPGPLVPITAIPSGLEPLLRRLLAKAPQARFARAAEVAASISTLWDADRPAEAEPGPPLGELPTRLGNTPPGDRTTRDLAPLGGELPPAPRADPVPLPVPEGWPPEPEPPPTLHGAGLGLFGLRPVPLVGREAERSALWDALRRVARGDGPRAVILRGPTGTGKTRLSTWLAEQAHAVAGAEVLVAVHGPVDGPAVGVGAMLARWLSVPPRPGPTVARVRALLETLVGEGAPGAEVTAEVIAPTGRLCFTHPEQRWAVVRDLLEARSSERPVVVRVEDAQWAGDTVAMVEWLLEQGPARVLYLLTAREETLAERPLEAPLVRSIAQHPGAVTVGVGPLPPVEREALVRAVLPMAPPVVEEVTRLVGGNPLFAVQLVGDWVSRGLLVPAEDGFRLSADADPEIPADLHEMWSLRLAAAVGPTDGEAGRALELAAVLGVEVDGREWRDVLDRVGLPVPRRLIESLIVAGLVRVETGDPEQGWGFVHALLRDAVLERAEARDRLAAHHRACAEVLAGRVGPGVSERRGRHLLDAGAWSDAADALLDAAGERLLGGELDGADWVLDLWEAAMTRAPAPPHDARWGLGWRRRYEVAYQRASLGAAEEWAQRVEDHARWHGWPELLVRAMLDRADVLNLRGASAEARELVERASELPAARRDPVLRATCLQWRGVLLAANGEADAALVPLGEAFEVLRDEGDPVDAANAGRFLAMAALRAGAPRHAVAAAEVARDLFDRVGHRAGRAMCENTLGEAWRGIGDLDAAERCYRTAAESLRVLGSDRRVVPRANLAAVLLELGRAREARDELAAVVEHPATRARPSLLDEVRGMLAEAERACAGADVQD